MKVKYIVGLLFVVGFMINLSIFVSNEQYKAAKHENELERVQVNRVELLEMLKDCEKDVPDDMTCEINYNVMYVPKEHAE